MSDILDHLLPSGERADLIYSPDDGGWYWQRRDGVVSTILFGTRGSAVEAQGSIEWES